MKWYFRYPLVLVFLYGYFKLDAMTRFTSVQSNLFFPQNLSEIADLIAPALAMAAGAIFWAKHTKV